MQHKVNRLAGRVREAGDFEDVLGTGMEHEAPPRIIAQMRDRNEATAIALAEEQSRERRQENISLNTRRDIRCFVMTEAELSSLIIASTLITICSAFPAIMLLLGLGIVIYNPGLKDLVGSAVIGVVVLGLVGGVIASYWRNSIVNTIRNGANFDAQR
jgi:hypothetical protein